jgi:hypothetical protein
MRDLLIQDLLGSLEACMLWLKLMKESDLDRLSIFLVLSYPLSQLTGIKQEDQLLNNRSKMGQVVLLWEALEEPFP